MSHMRKLLESMDKFAGEKVGQKPGEQWRGDDHGTPGNKLVGGAAESADQQFEDELMQEWARYLDEDPPANVATPPGQTPKPGQTPQTAQPGQTVQAPNAAQPQQGQPGQTAQTGQPPPPTKPGQVTTTAAKPNAAAQGTMPPDPQQVNVLNQIKTATNNMKLNPQKAAQAMAVNIPLQSRTADQKAQVAAFGDSMASIANAQNLPKIKSMLQTTPTIPTPPQNTQNTPTGR